MNEEEQKRFDEVVKQRNDLQGWVYLLYVLGALGFFLLVALAPKDSFISQYWGYLAVGGFLVWLAVTTPKRRREMKAWEDLNKKE
jgi:DMSO/TMAO reductase YedYZ heme-binding membrane subunit